MSERLILIGMIEDICPDPCRVVDRILASDFWRDARNDTLEEAAREIEPRNDPNDWTEHAKIRARCAEVVRSLRTGGGE